MKSADFENRFNCCCSNTDLINLIDDMLKYIKKGERKMPKEKTPIVRVSRDCRASLESFFELAESHGFKVNRSQFVSNAIIHAISVYKEKFFQSETEKKV